MGKLYKNINPKSHMKCVVCKKSPPRTLEFWYRDSSRGDGLGNRCKLCAKKYVTNWSKNNRPFINLRVSKTRFHKKIEAVKKLGGKCVCCGITEWWNLTFDHIDYRTRKKNDLNMNRVYNEIINEKTNIYQLMCFGCNSSKHQFDKCQIHNNGVDLYRQIK